LTVLHPSLFGALPFALFPFFTSGPDLEALPDCYVSMEFLRAPIPGKGSGSTTTKPKNLREWGRGQITDIKTWLLDKKLLQRVCVKLNDSTVSVEFLYAPIPRKGSGSTTITRLERRAAKTTLNRLFVLKT